MPSYCRVLNKSYPRNQRYLHPRFFGAGEFVCKVVEGSKFAEQLDPEISFIGNEAYFLDECPDGFGGFDPIAFLEGFSLCRLNRFNILESFEDFWW